MPRPGTVGPALPDEGAGLFQHYFSERPRAPHRRQRLRFLYRGRILTCVTDSGVFGSTGLDPGTALLIENMETGGQDRVLDLGCGWGPIGLAAALAAPEGWVLLVDLNHRAVSLARENLRSNGVRNAEVRQGALYGPVGEDRFDLIASNPPYHAGRAVVEQAFQGAPAHLSEGGRLLVVGKGNQGIRYYQRWLGGLFDRVEVLARSGGYRVLEAREPKGPGRGRAGEGGRDPARAKS
jgi:16S rRNA (guanine1207-N2)-methyltransferase